ncbi:MAG: DMT family transporter [Archaeoglobaceae archaeon]
MKGEILALIAAILWGLAPIFDKYALSNVQSIYPALVVRAFGAFATISLLSFALKETNFGISLKPIVSLLIAGAISGAIAMTFYFRALEEIGASRAVPITAVYPMFTAVFSLIILSEALTPRLLFGILLIIVGIILVSEG